MAAPQPPARRSPWVRVVLPTAAVGIVMFVLGSLLGAFLQDPGPLRASLTVAWIAFGLGRALGHWDFPKGLGVLAQRLLAGVTLGFVGFGIFQGYFENGPSGWALAAGLGFGLYRAHKPLLERAQKAPERGRLWGVLDRRELAALALLLAGYTLLGFSLHRLFLAFSGFIPSAGKALTLGVAIYALHGARLLLKFAAHDAAPDARGFVPWLKANLLTNAIVVLVLVAYMVYRGDLARALPMFPLVEFGLGIAVFGFVLGRLRSRLKREGTATATASVARPHRQHVALLTEGEYETVARPVGLFLETGRAAGEYADTLVASVQADEATAQRLLAPLRAHREPPPTPALPLPWSLLSTAVASVFVAVAVGVLVGVHMGAPPLIVLALGLGVVGLGAYRAQDTARAHLRGGLGFALAAWGVALLFTTFLLFAQQAGGVSIIPGSVWGVGLGLAAVALAIPGYLGSKQARALARGALVVAPREPAPREIAVGIDKARRRAGMAAGVALGVLVLVPPLLRWAAGHGLLPQGLPAFYADAASVGIWIVAAVGGGALVRLVGYGRARPLVLAEEKRKRDARLRLHHQIMSQLENV